jgi:hypothetical protein
MSKMKKTLGILLAVCFVLSVTVAAVNAAPGSGNNILGTVHNTVPGPGPIIKPGPGPIIKPGPGPIIKPGPRNNIKQKGKWIPRHCENKVVKKVLIIHHKRVVVPKVVKVCKPGKWIYFR